jgi:hypothetical protein
MVIIKSLSAVCLLKNSNTVFNKSLSMNDLSSIFIDKELMNYLICRSSYLRIKKEQLKSISNNNDAKRYKMTQSKQNNRCDYIECDKKLKLVELEIKCKCSKKFCSKHRYYTDHRCKYNYRRLHKCQISLNNPSIVPKKFEQI